MSTSFEDCAIYIVPSVSLTWDTRDGIVAIPCLWNCIADLLGAAASTSTSSGSSLSTLLKYWKYKRFIEVYWNWYSSYCLLLAHDIAKCDFITWFKCVRCTVYPYSVYVGCSKVTSGAIVCLFGTAVPVSLSTWHFNLPLLKVQRNLVYEHSWYTILYTM